MNNLVVLRVLNVQPRQEEHKEQHANIFYMKCKVLTKTCLVINDGGSCTNVISDKLVSKLKLQELKHPSPYRLQWLGDSGDLKVTTRVTVPMKVGEFEEEVLCDVIPMSACHILLGRPLEYDNKVMKDGYTNEYSFVYYGKKIRLKPLTPNEIFEAHKHLSKEHEREKRLERDCEVKKPSECGVGERKSKEKMSAPRSTSERRECLLATKSELGWALKSQSPLLIAILRQICLTNTNLEEIPKAIQIVLQEFEDVFPEELSNELPPIRGIEHQMDFLPGASLPNRPA
ncbi:uncharacterized protein LOC121764463 [Salvia splendens]|uniref:uncharacterized protein LOC121764463 n=1 Tax=Salvia splendens TaxID=180675 RepID=UPI001C25194B|nr:uncharacterized protein LOC121764463 [Salvia splendens]